MPWKRGTEPKRSAGQVSPFHAGLLIQSLSLIDPADPTKGHRIKALAASDRVNSGRIRIRSSAWRFRRQGAPMLYEHGNDPRIGRSPIGRWDKFNVQEGVGLVAEGVVFHFEAPDARATVVQDMVSGLLTDVSVGHAPAKMEIAKSDDGGFLDVQETTLGEISVVSVGMDGDATFELMAASAYGYEWSDDEDRGTEPQHGGKMDKKLLIQLLNMAGQSLKEDATEAEILSALQKVTQSASLGSRASELLGAIGLEQSASIDAVKIRIAEIRNPAGFVPKADYDKLVGITTQSAIDTLLAQSVNIPEGQKDFAKSLLKQGHEPGSEGRKLFDAWYASLPPLRTQSITGPGAGNPPRGNEGDNDVTITEEDRYWCQTLAYFRDERDASGKVTIKGVERMAQMAEMSSSEALSLLLGQPVPETALDKAIRESASAR